MIAYRAPLTIEAYLRIPFRVEEAHFAHMWATHIEPAVQQSIRDDAGYAWFYEDTPIACAGATVLWPGMANVWFHMGDTLGPRWRSVVVDVRKALYEVCDRLNLRRAQAQAACDFPQAHTFLMFLGLEPETMLRKYDPRGGDMVQYRKLWERSA